MSASRAASEIVFEYVGPGAAALEVPARATIANMGAEMGATTSIFPADAQVKKFMTAQGRGDKYVEMLPDEDAEYDECIDINLSELEPLISCPHQPDNVIPLKDAEKKRVQQVFIGSCTNASYTDIAKAALVFNGRHVNEDVSCTCAIASKQTYRELLRDGYIEVCCSLQVSECWKSHADRAAPSASRDTKGVAVRTSNRNFKGH
ncbi:MAG: aconitase family protein [Clostridium sp.]